MRGWLGDFDNKRSDIDLLAVTPELVGPEAERSIAQRLPEWQDRVEVGYFPSAVLSHFEEPLRDVYLICPGEPFYRTPARPHWLTDFYSLQEHGYVLYGPATADVLPPISAARFRARFTVSLPTGENG